MQFDIRGDPYGILAAHPLAPLVSLHHLDHVEPLFPNQTRIDSLNLLMQAYRVDSSRILQQSVCYDQRKKWSISIAWGYAVQIYPFMVTATDIEIPFQTFKTWRSSSDGPFNFNTRPVSSDPCWRPVVYFLKQVHEVDTRGTKTTYERFVAKEEKVCEKVDYARVVAVKQVTVSSMKMDSQLWMKVISLTLLTQSFTVFSFLHGFNVLYLIECAGTAKTVLRDYGQVGKRWQYLG